MKRLIYLSILCVCLSSCGLFKSTTRTKSVDRSSTEVNYKKDSADLTVDRSTITTTERADTTIITKRKTLAQNSAKPVTPDTLYKGMTSMVNDLLTVTLKLDSVTGILNTSVVLHPISIPVQFDKTTRTERDITKSVVTGTDIAYTKETKQVQAVKEKQPTKMGIWLIFALVIIICSIAWYVNRKLFK